MVEKFTKKTQIQPLAFFKHFINRDGALENLEKISENLLQFRETSGIIKML